MRGLVVAGALLCSGVALADERFDHHGSLGLTAAFGGEFVTAVSLSDSGERGGRLPLELGGTFAVGNHSELRLAARLSPGISPITALGASFYGGLRNSFGYEQ